MRERKSVFKGELASGGVIRVHPSLLERTLSENILCHTAPISRGNESALRQGECDIEILHATRKINLEVTNFANEPSSPT